MSAVFVGAIQIAAKTLGDGGDAGLELGEGGAGAGPEMKERPASGTEDAAVLAPEQEGRAMEQQ